MNSDRLGHAIAAEGSASGVAELAPPRVNTRTWTKQKWSTYLQQMRKEVEVGEAPIELYPMVWRF